MSAGKIFRRIVSTDLAQKPIGPYHQAVVINNTVYVSGICGIDPRTNNLVEGGAIEESKQAFMNMKQILAAADSKMNNVVKTTVLLADMGDFPGVNEVYQKNFNVPYPARTTFQVAKLPMGAKFEIEAIAMVGEIVDGGCDN